MKESMIYLVRNFQPRSNGTYLSCCHVVAATSSAEAEQILRQSHPEPLEDGMWFIQTDEFTTRAKRRTMVNMTFDIEEMNETQFQEWLDLATVARIVHKEVEPAIFRRMTTQKEGDYPNWVCPEVIESVATANAHLNNAGLPTIGDMLQAVSTGAPAVIGFEANGERQSAFSYGWNEAMNRVFAHMSKTLHVQRLIENAEHQD